MEIIEMLKEFGTQIVVAISGIGIMTILLFMLKWFKPIFEGIVKPLFNKFKDETNEHLLPLENKLDTILEALAFDYKTKSESPVISDYEKEKYLEYASKLIALKNIEVTNKTIETIDLVEETIDKGLDTVEDYFDRKG